MNDVIIGSVVSLRPITNADTSLIVKWRNNPNVQKNFIFREPFTSEMHLNWMKTKVATGNVVQYIIIQNKDETPVGSVYYRDIDYKSRIAEFGIFIGEDTARGKGFGTQATQLFVNYGFSVLNFHRIFLRLLAENTVAVRTYLAAGFKLEGQFRDMVVLDDSGVYHDVIFMSILETDDLTDFEKNSTKQI